MYSTQNNSSSCMHDNCIHHESYTSYKSYNPATYIYMYAIMLLATDIASQLKGYIVVIPIQYPLIFNEWFYNFIFLRSKSIKSQWKVHVTRLNWRQNITWLHIWVLFITGQTAAACWYAQEVIKHIQLLQIYYSDLICETRHNGAM